MEDRIIINIIKDAERLRNDKRISILEAYNIILSKIDFNSLSEEQLKCLLIVLKSEMKENVDYRPFTMRITLVVGVILCLLGSSLGLLIPIEFLKWIWLGIGGLLTFEVGKKGLQLLVDAKNNMKQQLITTSSFVKEIERVSSKNAAKKVINLDLIKKQDKTSQNYIKQLLESIEGLFPYVPSNMIQDYSLRYLNMKRIYFLLFNETQGKGVYNLLNDGEDIEQYRKNPELFTKSIETLLDELIEITAMDNLGLPASRSDIIKK